MPARRCRKSQLSIAREGFLDRRSKRCFWLLLSPQTKVARAGARNYPRRRHVPAPGREIIPVGDTFPRPGAKLSPSETNNARLRRCGGDASSATASPCHLSPCGSVRGSDTPPACHSTPRPIKGNAWGCGGRSEKRLPWLRQAAASASAPVSVHAVLLTDNGDERLCPREDAGNHSRP